jgi:hypothetical protein
MIVMVALPERSMDETLDLPISLSPWNPAVCGGSERLRRQIDFP